MQYPPVAGMTKAYPELRDLEAFYRKEGFTAKEADEVLRYMSVLCDQSTPDKTIKGRERLATQQVSDGCRGKLELGKKYVEGEDGMVQGGYHRWVAAWFMTVHSSTLSTWFATKSALNQQNEFLMSPLDPTRDVEDQIETKRKTSEKIGSLLDVVERLEAKLFATFEHKKIVNETLERHRFAGFPELFALSRN